MASTMQSKLLTALRTGRELTAAQIQAFGFAKASTAVSNLRNRSLVAVYGNKRTLKNGTSVIKYRIGTPTAAMSALGYTS